MSEKQHKRMRIQARKGDYFLINEWLKKEPAKWRFISRFFWKRKRPDVTKATKKKLSKMYRGKEK